MATAATTIEFCKMQSLGNDFMLVDARNKRWAPDTATVRAWGDRRLGVGFDQLLLLVKAANGAGAAHCAVYNADGSEAGQCGNGARCVAAYLRANGGEPRMQFTLGDASAEIKAEVGEDGKVTVHLAPPSFDADEIGFGAALKGGECVLPTSSGERKFALVSMGNPHAVTQVDDVRAFPAGETGREVQALEVFKRGVNVGFMQVLGRDRLRLRVVERGCGETRACGSGACAAVVVGRRRNLLDESVRVAMPGGELEIGWAGDGQPVRMTGTAEHVYDGEVTPGGGE